MIKKIFNNGIEVAEYESTGNDMKDLKIAQEILKSKGLYIEVTSIQAMYRQANSFANLAISIYENDLRQTPAIMKRIAPFVVNSVFCVELYLKTTHAVYGKPPTGHSLVNLYNALPDDAKELILRISEELRARYNLNKGWDIHTCINSLDKAFEQWRYIYEYNGLEIELQSIRYLMHVVGLACSDKLTITGKK